MLEIIDKIRGQAGMLLDSHNKFTRKQLVNLEKEGYDLDWLKQIAPQGGLYFDEVSGVESDGLFNCLEINGFSKLPKFAWLSAMMNNQYTISTLDTMTDPKDKLINNIESGLNELLDRSQNANKTIDQEKSKAEYLDMLAYADALTQGGEVAKQIRLRIYIYAPTRELLEERTNAIRTEIQTYDYKANVFLFEAGLQYEALFLNLEEQNELLNNRTPFSIRSLNIGGGLPFHHQSLLDQNGYPYGTTQTGGAFIWDIFGKTKTRLSYNGAVLGMMGAGKSNLLKMIEEAMTGAGNKVRAIDIVGDFKTLTKKQNGTYVNLDGSDGMINPLEIFATIIDRDTFKVDEAKSFTQNISRISDQFRFLNPSFNNYMIQQLRTYLSQFYMTTGLLPKDFQTNLQFKITGLKSSAYPTLSEFLIYLNRVRLPENATPNQLEALESIKSTVTDAITSYGNIFDGHSTISDLSAKQIVVFGTGELESQAAEIFHCQIYTALTMMWNHALQNGIQMKYLYDQNKIKNEDIIRCILFLDECHNIVNTNMLFAVQFVSRFEREMRKFFAGLWLATQSPEEMVPENATGEAQAAIKTVLQFTQNKVLMRTDSSTIPAVKRLLGDSITDSEYNMLPSLQVGQAVVNLGAKETYKVQFEPDKSQLRRFEGGQ